MRLVLFIALFLAVPRSAVAADVAAADPAAAVAVLQRACYECHGPEKQKGGLRLDSREAAIKGGESGPAVVAGTPGKSELLSRLALPADQDGAMPPRGERLTAAQVQTLKEWIQQGAAWPAQASRHWAYVKPLRPALPKAANTDHPRPNAIDAFIVARLQKEGWTPSPQASRETLIRRLSLDLTGLPPTPAEIDAFLADSTEAAYERAVDRLLASPQFGVKWARSWLDAARYADSHGYQRDDLRDIWAYRDWVVDALNADMPFDQFTVEQLAGDLLPNATQSQRIATGFNRNAPTNVEAGTDPEETRVNQVMDRVNTLGTIWLGSTIECAQCHDHKYDPFSQKDYYQLFAFFNSTTKEAERSNPKVPGSIRFLGPEMSLTDAGNSKAQEKLQQEVAAANQQLAARSKLFETPDAAWEAATLKTASEGPSEHVLEITDFDSIGGATHEVLKDGSVLVSGDPPDKDTYTIVARTRLTGIRGFKLEALTDPSLPGKGPGRGDANRPNFVLNTFAVTATKPGGKPEAVTFKSARADFSQAKFSPEGAIDDDPKSAWAINPKFHEPHWAVFESAAPVGFDGGTELTFTLVQNFGGGRTIGRVRLSALTGSGQGTSIPAAVAEALAVVPAKRSGPQKKAIADYRLAQDAEYVRLQNDIRSKEAELAKAPSVKTLVMQEMPATRPSMLFSRGDFRSPGASVAPGTPGLLPPMPADAERNRVGLARWLVSRDNPLTARVTVNRLWAELFGQGIVATPEDFGIKGDPPSHPELLDWLAVEFMEPTAVAGGAKPWSIKHIVRTMVLSNTYRQSSRLTPELLSKDPTNRLLARGPRFRLDAEAIRDNALAIGGLLSPKLGGPPVRPPQPDGLWTKVGGAKYDYVVSPGEDKYRRGLYVVWKRSAPYPSFVAFDAPERFACRVKRPRTNTPLQALTLLNDPVYVEAAMAFARRLVAETPSASVDARITHAFRLALGRTPDAGELGLLRTLFDAESDAMTAAPAVAKQFVGKAEIPAGMSAGQFAAWYAVSAAILNLDETITKG
ncbi:PSD1 and planctomycete cytochrome C domain-containing protein [Humisphaera borealis]|uniref:PSD1 domain-containing protein n=1 Tax=Humisphaera borealis TaxID=2807512 RepID=A0A7M2WWE8_9BACT|nr:PSD1 and planctomycete cytochrome C domain-containing protein [Humisphaera borealis]QOV89733.1 PSD1 domain-containing protein [Humisphaera borealis]